MSQSRTAVSVGIFVTITLLVMGLLLLQFSKGNTLLRHTYTIILKSGNVGGLRNKASVLMSGVQVGTVSGIVLSPEGRNRSTCSKWPVRPQGSSSALIKQPKTLTTPSARCGRIC